MTATISIDYKGYVVKTSIKSLGNTPIKNTSTVQVIIPYDTGPVVKKWFRYTVGDKESNSSAFGKAKAWIDANPI